MIDIRVCSRISILFLYFPQFWVMLWNLLIIFHKTCSSFFFTVYCKHFRQTLLLHHTHSQSATISTPSSLCPFLVTPKPPTQFGHFLGILVTVLVDPFMENGEFFKLSLSLYKHDICFSILSSLPLCYCHSNFPHCLATLSVEADFQCHSPVVIAHHTHSSVPLALLKVWPGWELCLRLLTEPGTLSALLFRICLSAWELYRKSDSIQVLKTPRFRHFICLMNRFMRE